MSKEIDNGIDDDIDTNTDDINISDDKNVSDDNDISDSEKQIFGEESVTETAESEKIFDEEQNSQKEDSDTIFEAADSQLPPDDSAATTVLTGMTDAVGNISGTQESDNVPAETGTRHETKNQDNKIENKKSGTKKIKCIKNIWNRICNCGCMYICCSICVVYVSL